MALSVNDVMSRPRSIAVAAGDAISTGRTRIFGMSVGSAGAGDAVLTINNALTTGGGGTTIVLKCGTIAHTTSLYFGEAGIVFPVGLSILVAGTATVTLTVLYILE